MLPGDRMGPSYAAFSTRFHGAQMVENGGYILPGIEGQQSYGIAIFHSAADKHVCLARIKKAGHSSEWPFFFRLPVSGQRGLKTPAQRFLVTLSQANTCPFIATYTPAGRICAAAVAKPRLNSASELAIA